jgi:antitoxin HigA-1
LIVLKKSGLKKIYKKTAADTALRLSKYFGTSAKFWLELQDDYDLEESGNLLAAELLTIPTAVA